MLKQHWDSRTVHRQVFRLLWRACCLLLLASMTCMFILFLLYFTWWILFSACMRGLQAIDVKVSVYLQGMYKQRAWSKPHYHQRSHHLWKSSCLFQIQIYVYIYTNTNICSSSTIFENLFFRGEKRGNYLFFNFPLVGGYIFLRATFCLTELEF